MILEFLPEHSTWDEWNAQLIHYFSEQQFELLPEDHWQDVARSVVVNPVFDKYSPPMPSIYSDWREWARALTVTVNGA